MKEHVFKETSIERVHPEGRRLSYDIAEKIAALKLDGVYLVKEAKDIIPMEICYLIVLAMLVLIIKVYQD